MRDPKSFLKIVTRAKEPADGDSSKASSRVVELRIADLEAQFKYPLVRAAARLGISLTALKWCVPHL